MGIPIENIKPGMGLVVLRGPKRKRRSRDPFSVFDCASDVIVEEEDVSWNGSLLICLAVSPPYLLCRFHSYDSKGTVTVGTGPVDTRILDLGVASDAFIKAFTARGCPKTPDVPVPPTVES